MFIMSYIFYEQVKIVYNMTVNILDNNKVDLYHKSQNIVDVVT